MALLIGLTGPPGSGKSAAAMSLARLARERGLEVVHFSLSDEIRKEVGRREIDVSRDALKQTAHAFRSRVGNGVWALLVSSRIEETLAEFDEDVAASVLVLIDGIRNPGEVNEFRARFGDRFRLLAITTSPEFIRRNLQRRRRADETKELLENEHALRNLIASEMGEGEPGFGHNVSACIAMADWPPIDNDGLLEDLERKVSSLADQHIFRLLAARTPRR